MPQMLIVNPSPRPLKRAKPARRKAATKSALRAPKPQKGKTTMRNKARTAAQQRATRKMIAANRSRRKPVRKNPAPRQAAPAKRRRTVARASATGAAAPARRRRSVARAAPARATRRRRTARRNPTISVNSVLQNYLYPAANGVAGSLVVDGLFGYAPLPAELSSGYGRHATKTAMALILGVFGSRVFAAKTATAMAIGSLTVTGHEMGRELLANFAPDLALDGMSTPMGAYVTGPGAQPGARIPGVGAYVSGPGADPDARIPAMNGMGYINPAMTSGSEGNYFDGGGY